MSLLNTTTGEVCIVTVLREALVLEVLDRFREGNNVPFACNMLFNGPCSPSSGSRISAQDAETRLLEQTVGHVAVEAIFPLEVKVAVDRWVWHSLYPPSGVQGLQLDRMFSKKYMHLGWTRHLRHYQREFHHLSAVKEAV